MTGPSNKAVGWFMAAVTVVLIALDWLLYKDGRDGNTYSERLRWLGHVWPPARLIIVFALGALCSHWWGWG